MIERFGEIKNKFLIPFLAVWLFFCVPFSVLHSEEAGVATPAETVPNPLKLDPAWFEYIEKAPREKLPARISALLENVTEVSKNLTEENREKLSPIVKEIRQNLEDYAKISAAPLPVVPPPGTIAKSYSIDDLLRVYRSLLKKKFEKKTKEAEREDLLKLKSQLQSKIDQSKQAYDSANERSFERLLSGLERISYGSAMQVLLKKIRIADKNIEIINSHTEHLDEELKAAKKRLETTPEELLLLARGVGPEKLIWNEARRNRQEKAPRLKAQLSEETTVEAESANQYLNLSLIELQLREIKAAVSLYRAEILYTIANLTFEPESVDLDTLITSEKDWRRNLTEKKSTLEDLAKQIERIRQIAVKQIPLEEQKEGKESILEVLNKSVKLSQNNYLLIESASQEINEALFLLDLLVEREIILEGKGRQWLRLIFEIASEAFESSIKKLSSTLFYIGPHPVNALGIIKFFLIMIASWWISKLIKKAINTFARHRKGLRKAIIYRLTRLLHYLILIIGLLIALTSIGFDFSNLIIIAGALGVGIGFGMQNIFNNFISGIIILFQSQLKVGDFVELDSGIRGEIREINFRSTVITTNDGVDVIVPNSEMISNRMINWTLRDPYKRVRVPFSVAYGTDLDKVAKIVAESAKKQPATLQKIGISEPSVIISRFGDNGIEMLLNVWVREKWSKRPRRTLSIYLKAIHKTLKAHNIVIPFPQRDVHIIETDK